MGKSLIGLQRTKGIEVLRPKNNKTRKKQHKTKKTIQMHEGHDLVVYIVNGVMKLNTKHCFHCARSTQDCSTLAWIFRSTHSGVTVNRMKQVRRTAKEITVMQTKFRDKKKEEKRSKTSKRRCMMSMTTEQCTLQYTAKHHHYDDVEKEGPKWYHRIIAWLSYFCVARIKSAIQFRSLSSIKNQCIARE